MLTMQEHLALAERSEHFAESITSLPTRFPEWEITALFYSALHYTSAFLATEGHNPTNHHIRNRLVARLTQIGQDYQNLFRLSMNARYRETAYTAQQVEALKAGPFRRVKEETLALLANQTGNC